MTSETPSSIPEMLPFFCGVIFVEHLSFGNRKETYARPSLLNFGVLSWSINWSSKNCSLLAVSSAISEKNNLGVC